MDEEKPKAFKVPIWTLSFKMSWDMVVRITKMATAKKTKGKTKVNCLAWMTSVSITEAKLVSSLF